VVAITAGTGGASASGTSGAGGSITSVGAASETGGVSAIAGDAGDATGSTKGANGGSLANVSLSALTFVTIIAGDGQGGGSGGNLTTIAFTGADVSGPLLGSIIVMAGDGSASTNNSVAGKGGYIKTVSGYANVYESSGTAVTTLIKAGDGASGSKKGADGGSITDLSLFGGQFVSSVNYINQPDVNYVYGDATIWAGEAGSSSSTGAGGKGGSISGLTLAQGLGTVYTEQQGGTFTESQVQLGVDIDNLAAGNGGNSTDGKGGLGGSITNVYSLGDIGTRSGKSFGFNSSDPSMYYNLMGGIFAGLGGTGDKGNGAAGNVTSVTANAIASIVAGKTADSFGFVTKVDSIFLNGNGNNDPEVNPNGSFSNWGTSVFVGSIAGNPTDADSDVYKTAGDVPWTSGDTWDLDTTQPMDGLIAALTLTSKRNFSPMAFLTLDSSGNTQFAGVRVP